jgi:hypothetical protein
MEAGQLQQSNEDWSNFFRKMISFLTFFFFYFNVGEREIQSPISSKK